MDKEVSVYLLSVNEDSDIRTSVVNLTSSL